MSGLPDLPDVRLVVRRRCGVCEGTGEVRSEDWEGYEAWLERGNTADPEDYFHDVQRMDSVPPMKRECGNCEGGWVDGDIAASDLVEVILAQVPTAVIPREDLEEIARDVRISVTQAAQRSRGLADPEDLGSWLRVVQEGAEALRAIGETLVRREP